MKSTGGAVFLDTSGLLATISSRDSLHAHAARVLALLHSERVQTVTSDWVLCELLAGASGRALRGSAIEMARLLRNEPTVFVEPATRASWDRAFSFYCDRPDK